MYLLLIFRVPCPLGKGDKFELLGARICKNTVSLVQQENVTIS